MSRFAEASNIDTNRDSIGCEMLCRSVGAFRVFWGGAVTRAVKTQLTAAEVSMSPEKGDMEIVKPKPISSKCRENLSYSNPLPTPLLSGIPRRVVTM